MATREDIIDLMNAAVSEGDTELVRSCKMALDGNENSSVWRRCAQEIERRRANT